MRDLWKIWGIVAVILFQALPGTARPRGTINGLDQLVEEDLQSTGEETEIQDSAEIFDSVPGEVVDGRSDVVKKIISNLLRTMNLTHSQNTRNSSRVRRHGLVKRQATEQCGENMLPCDDQLGCYSLDKRCDGLVTCFDASDETGCSCHERIASRNREKLCDSYPDCPDFSDERGCYGCSPGEITCRSKGKSTCIAPQAICDGKNDCDYGSDEEFCTRLTHDQSDSSPVQTFRSEGFLQVKRRGIWLPVCGSIVTTYTAAVKAHCEEIVGERIGKDQSELRPNEDPRKRYGHYDAVSRSYSVSSRCDDQMAVFVKCSEPTCGALGYNRRKKREDDIQDIFEGTDNDYGKGPAGRFGSDFGGHSGGGYSGGYGGDKSSHSGGQISGVYSGRDGNDNGSGDSDFHINMQMNATYRIIGGRMTEPYAWSFAIGIISQGKFHCGGSIINSEWILTAAHCFFNHFLQNEMEIIAGMYRRFSWSPFEQTSKISHVIRHPKFNDYLQNDMALVKLQTPLQLNRWVRPSCLTQKHAPTKGEMCTVAGWGTQVEQDPGAKPDTMMEVEVPIWKTCTESFRGYSDESLICAGYEEGKRDACAGDSGGPLMCSGDEGWVQTGAVSFGRGCAQPNEPGSYSRITYFLPWINKMTNLVRTEAHLAEYGIPLKTVCPTFECLLPQGRCVHGSLICNEEVNCLDVLDERSCYKEGANKEDDTFSGTLNKEDDAYADTNAHDNADTNAHDNADTNAHDNADTNAHDNADTNAHDNAHDNADANAHHSTDAPHANDNTPVPYHYDNAYVTYAHEDYATDKYDDTGVTEPYDNFYTDSIIYATGGVYPEDSEYGEEGGYNNFFSISHTALPPDHPDCYYSDFICEQKPQCVPMSRVCDGAKDCDDGTDERSCTCLDRLLQFNNTWHCDGYYDCFDLSDENCPPPDICQGMFICPFSRECVPHNMVCNAQIDCMYGEDEMGCLALLMEPGKLVLDKFLEPELSSVGILAHRGDTKWEPVCAESLGWQTMNEICVYLGYRNVRSSKSVIGPTDLEVTGPSSLTAYTRSGMNRIKVESELVQSTYNLKRVTRDIHEDEAQTANPADMLSFLKEVQAIRDSNRKRRDASDMCLQVEISCKTEPCGRIPRYALSIEHPVHELGGVPWAATVFINGHLWCGGTLIHPYWVVTSKLCMEYREGQLPDLSIEFVSVVMGSLREAGETTRLWGAYEHDRRVDYMKASESNDILVLHLIERMPKTLYINHLCLPTTMLDNMVANRTCTIAGYDVSNQRTSKGVELHADAYCGPNELCFPKTREMPCMRSWSGIIACKFGWKNDPTWAGVGMWTYQPYDDYCTESSSHRLFTLDDLQFIREAREHFEAQELASCDGRLCPGGACVSADDECNANLDCADLSDEPPTCEPLLHMCKSDKYGNNCTCADGGMPCEDGVCVSRHLVCDGKNHCKSGEDEADCTCAREMWRDDTDKLCNGILDCDDAEDEAMCGCEPSTDFFRCYKSNPQKCIARTNVCNGEVDCYYGEDEQDCVALTDVIPADENPLGQLPVKSEGYFLIRVRGRWFTFLHEKWDEVVSFLVCSQLGYGHKQTESRDFSANLEGIVYITCYSN